MLLHRYPFASCIDSEFMLRFGTHKPARWWILLLSPTLLRNFVLTMCRSLLFDVITLLFISSHILLIYVNSSWNEKTHYKNSVFCDLLSISDKGFSWNICSFLFLPIYVYVRSVWFDILHVISSQNYLTHTNFILRRWSLKISILHSFPPNLTWNS